MTARQVILEGGSPWGFRIHGGFDVGTPIKISRVNPGSKAAQKGIREGDIISSINGTSTKSLDNSAAHSLLRSAGEQLRLNLNEDGLSSPKRRLKQKLTGSIVTEEKTSSCEVVNRNIEVRKFGNEEEKKTEKVQAQVHAEQKRTAKNNEMPRKNKKSKKTSDTISVSEEKVKTLQHTDEKLVTEKPEKKGLFLTLDQKIKLQMKKQKKKERKREFEGRNKKGSEEISFIPNIDWETAEEMKNVEAGVGNIVEDVVQIMEVKLIDGTNKETKSSEEEEENLKNFLRTLNIVDAKKLKNKTEMEAIRDKVQIETIPEDLFKEFLENEEVAQKKETIKKFLKTSPLHAPNLRREYGKEPALAGVHCSPKVVYNYQGVSYLEPVIKSKEGIEDNFATFETYQNSDSEIWSRRLDIILEESSDYSDASGNSEKKVKQKNYKETVKIKDDVENRIMHPVFVENTKILGDDVDLGLTKSELKTEINPISASALKIVNLEESANEYAKSEFDKDGFCDGSVKSICSAKNLEEESDSWRSSLNLEDGAEADVESELDNQRTAVFDRGDDLSIKMSDLLDNSIEIFITDYKTEKPCLFDKTFSGTDKSYYSTSSKTNLNSGYPGSLDNKEITDKVSVRDIAEIIKDDMDKILKSKLKKMSEYEAPQFAVSSQSVNIQANKLSSSESSLKLKTSDPGSYENVRKCEKVIRVVEEPIELRKNPDALSNLAEKKVLTLPYGKLVLKKIGLGSCCSKDSGKELEEEEEVYVKNSNMSANDKKSHRIKYIEFDHSSPKMETPEKWYGMRTSFPSLFVGLSPSQKKVYEEKQKKWLTNEAEGAYLLDLHKKFLERRSYHENEPWFRERNILCDSIADVAIADISKSSESLQLENERTVIKNLQDICKSERKPEKPSRRSLEKKKIGGGLLNSRCYVENCSKNKLNDLKVEETKTKTKAQISEVGKSRLLAILQNAISDEFVPKLNTDSSIESNSESHEVPLTTDRETMLDSWQEEKSKSRSRQQPSHPKDHKKTFQDFWNREKNYVNGDKTRLIYRPKTICCENESELYITEPTFVKEVRPPTKTNFDKLKEKETLIVTENLPSVSDIIKYFEEPRPKQFLKDELKRPTKVEIENEKYQISKKGDIAVIQSSGKEKHKEKRKSMPESILSKKEIFKQKMFDEYMSKLAERMERRQQKVIRVSKSNEIESPEETKFLDLENEFITKVKERKDKLEMKKDESNDLLLDLKKKCQEFRNYWENETSNLEEEKNLLFVKEEKNGRGSETNSKRSSIQLLDTTTDVENLPKHLKELLQVDGEEFPELFDGVWSPAGTVFEVKTEEREENEERKKLENEPIPPVWTPKSTQASPVLEKKEFRPVNFESPTLPRKKYIQEDKKESSVPPPWQQPGGDKPPELAKSSSSPALSLPKAPNPTVTLLQKAREGHLPRGAHYLNTEMNDSLASDGNTIKRLEIVSSSKSEPERIRNLEICNKKIDGIGPTTKEGIPLVLRSEVTSENKEKWYKRMYDSLHKYEKDDDYVTVKYRTSPRRQGLYNYKQSSTTGYQSEPESLRYDISSNKYVTLDRRRNDKSKENDSVSLILSKSRNSPPSRDFRDYKNQPGRIEDYEPGHSSISETEANKWWDEVLEIFDREEERTRPLRKSQSPRSFTNYASGYISDPQYVVKRAEDELRSPPTSEEQKEAYRIIQKGGEIPLKGLRKPAPERPKESLKTEIEYFPLSPTLTRIRVHKQNITPLSEFPFLCPLYKHTTLNYPVLPFGVCSSFSQVQIFPSQFGLGGISSNSTKDQKFAVQLQNISGPDDYVPIVPPPRSLNKKQPIYVNIPLKKNSPSCSKKQVSGTGSSASTDQDTLLSRKKSLATFSELKRITRSVNAKAVSKVSCSKIPTEVQKKDNCEKKLSKLLVKPKKGKESLDKKKILEEKKIVKKGAKKEISISSKIPLSESVLREKPLLRTSKERKTVSSNLKKKKIEIKKKEEKIEVKEKEEEEEDIIDYLSRCSEFSDKSYVDLKNPESKEIVLDRMSPIYESVEPKPKMESNITEIFRSRSFSPDVKRKIYKLPDMNKPVPPKRKESKISPTLKMWSKMMVSYPRKSRESETNVKFLGNQIKRKLEDDKGKTEFGDDIETVRTVKKDKNGEMSIKTNRYVRLSRPTSTVFTRATYPDIERRKVLSMPKTKFGSADSIRSRVYSDASTKSVEELKKQKRDTIVRSSTVYSLQNPKKEDDKRKSVKVTVAISSKGKDLLKKSAGMSTPKKNISKSSSSPCPSVSSIRSGKSDKGSVASFLKRGSPHSSISPPSTSRSTSPSTFKKVLESTKLKKPIARPVVATYETPKPEIKKKIVTKVSEQKITTQNTKDTTSREKYETKIKKPENKNKTIAPRKVPETNEVVRGRDLIRTDSFFQNLFLRGTPQKKLAVERASVLERAHRYQNRINWPEVSKSEPSLSLATYYLNQKRPVSLSRFLNMDREHNFSRSYSPLGNFHSESFQMKLRRFDSMNQFGDGLTRDYSPDAKERSSSEPPLTRSSTNSPNQRLEEKCSRVSLSDASSMRSSPNSSRSPSYRRINSHRPTLGVKKLRARSAGEAEDRLKLSLECGDLGKSSSSLNLSNISDHTEYQAYILELMHSPRKCERFRELHKFYSNLERMGILEKTASTGDLRPRMRAEEIIDFDLWKKMRIKERAEAELKMLVESLEKEQKEKDLLFRAADVEAVRWKGDSGLRIKERSVDDLKEHFCRYSEENWKKEADAKKDNYKSLWRGNSIADVANSLNNTLVSHRGRPVTLEDLGKIEKANALIGREYGHTLKKWTSLSNEQVNLLKDQLSEIYAQDARRRYDESLEELSKKYDILVPNEGDVRSVGDPSLHVRCSSALSKSQTYTPTVKRKEEIRKEWKKADSIGALPSCGISLPQLPWIGGASRSQSEERVKQDFQPIKSKSGSSRALSETEKKRLSMTLSKEVIEKMSKASGKGPVFPRETLGALAAAGSKLREHVSDEKKSVESGEKFGKSIESGSGSSQASINTVIRKNPLEDLRKVQHFEDFQQGNDYYEERKAEKVTRKIQKEKKMLIPSSSLENINDYFGQQKQYAVQKPKCKEFKERSEDFNELRNYLDNRKWLSVRYPSMSPGLRSGSSSESLFSCRSRSLSPDPTKYYRAYLRMVKCGAVRKLCNKFESWEDLLTLPTDKDFWLPPPPRRFASDPELTRDLLKRFGTDPIKVTVRGQEVGNVRWLRTKFEKDYNPRRGRNRFQKVRSPLMKTHTDRFMPRINVISKTAELQLQKKDVLSKAHQMTASPEGYQSLIDSTKDTGGYYYTGEVEKLRKKFERLQEAERLSILGQMYTSAPDVNELRDIAPYLECDWVAHRYPKVIKTVSSPDLSNKRQETAKKADVKPRSHSSSPVRPKQSILKSSYSSHFRDAFADQKFDPSIHRPKYRYQPDTEVYRRYKRGELDWCRQWNKPTVTFKESVSFKPEPEIRDFSPESPRKYVESEVTIHYKSPVRSEAKAMLSEDELARRQAESMKRIYKEERRRKYLQELQDMNSRRHADNFIPSQKSPISLNRYDDFPLDSSAYHKREYTSDPILVARGLYDFVGKRPRELGFRRGDIIFIIRKLDKNWCEGELNGVVGLFPLSYVEVIPYNEINLKFGRAQAKYDFIPQTPMELLAHKGDMITLLRKIDENWFEGRIGSRTGIIPTSYCHVMALPQPSRTPARIEKSVSKPVASPAAHSLIHNGSGLSSKHYYTPYLNPSSPGRSTTSSASVNFHDGHPSADMLIDEALMQLDEEFDLKRSKPPSQPLNVRINPRPEPEMYQVLFNHVPNNDDELELIQGETVTVVEKCGDGWYIGSKSDGKLGIFPGTHVRRIGPEFV